MHLESFRTVFLPTLQAKPTATPTPKAAVERTTEGDSEEVSVPARKATKDSPESSNKQKVETPTRVYLGPPKNGGTSAVEGSNSSTTTKGGVAPTSPTTAAKPAVSTTAAPTTTTPTY